MDSLRDYRLGKSVHLQKSHIFIDAFLSKLEPLLNFRCYELRSLFYQTSAELFLSEIEILAWLIYIEENIVNSNTYNVKEFLIFVGLHTKIGLGSDINLFLKKIKEKNPRIIEKFKIWNTSNNLKSNISTIELGKKYRELSMPIGISRINYNFHIDDIIRSCTSYQKQMFYNIFDFSLDIENYNYKENVFEVKKKQKIFEDQEYNLREFDSIDN